MQTIQETKRIINGTTIYFPSFNSRKLRMVNNYGRSSDLLRLSAFPLLQWHRCLNLLELTAAGTVQDFHLFPSQSARKKPAYHKTSPKV
jgi:hypothetical protein